MDISIVPVSLSDLADLCDINFRAMADDSLVKAMLGTATIEGTMKFFWTRNYPRLDPGLEMGLTAYFKAVDENGKMLGWTGLGFPYSKEEAEKIKRDVVIPEGANMSVMGAVFGELAKAGLRCGKDSTKYCERQNIMVDPAYHRRGIGRMLVQKTNKIADDRGLVTYVQARPESAIMFRKMGFVVLERVDFDLASLGIEGGVTSSIRIMRREPGAEDDENAVL